MYDRIFDDFNIVKQHCEQNGNIKFEESTVFELLESFYPQHGSAESIQIIISMLDAQRVQDSKNVMSKNLVEVLNSDASSSNDSIVEVEVKKKVHPVIDLTEYSPQSDEPIADGKSNNQNVNSNVESDLGSDEDNHSDVASGTVDDVSKYFDDDFDKSYTPADAVAVLDERPLIDYFNLLLPTNKLHSSQDEIEQVNSRLADNSEILEENNNDPNNNFDEEPLESNNVTDNSSFRSLHTSENSIDVAQKVIDPIPGCSKDLELPRVNGLKNTDLDFSFNLSDSPIPGCSKDFSESFDLDDDSMFNDKSIEEDCNCIREIIPWAEKEKVNALLSKFSNSPNRKQLTLDSLMSEESNEFISAANKRKHGNDLCTTPNKVVKLDFSEYIEESSLDMTPNFPSNNIFYNDSSNDSRSSAMSDSLFLSTSGEFSDVSSKFEDSGTQRKPSLNKADQKFNCFIRNSHLMKTNSENKIREKKKNETIVSGSLYQNYHLHPIEFPTKNDNASNANNIEKKSNTNNSDSLKNDREIRGVVLNNGLKNSSSKQAESVANNKNQFQTEMDSVVENTFIRNIKNEIESEANLILQRLPTSGKATATSTKNDVVRPAKLLVSPTAHHQHVIKKNPNTFYIRPALLRYMDEEVVTNSNLPQQQERDMQIRFRLASSTNTNTVRLREHQPIPLIKPPLPPVPKILIKNGSSKLVEANQESANLNLPLIARSSVITKMKLNSVPPPPPLRNQTVTSTPKLQQSNNLVAQASTSKEKPDVLSKSIEVPDRNIYTKLRSIFPDVKKSYVKKICIEAPSKMNTNEKSNILNSLIDHLLVEGHNHQRSLIERHIIDQQQVEALSVDEQYEYLVGIFPDADPTFLREFVERNINNKEVIEQFIQEKLERRDYPTKEQYLAKIKITEQQKQYTSEFKVEKFLEIFPDPFKHFENEQRKCTYNPIAMEFLKSFFNRNKINTISRQYTLNSYNISLTARALSALSSDMKSKRSNLEMPTEDIPLLQEIAFVRNKASIQSHINTIKVQEDRLFQELKEKNLLITCQCCYNDECMPAKCSECDRGHHFCYECIIRGTESTLADGEAHVRCFTECTSEFSLATLQKILSPTAFSALLKKRQAAEVQAAGFEGLVSCPFCHFASIPPPEDKVFKCLNPECMKETCRQCKELNHVPLKCDEVVKTDKARRLIEEKMTEALIRTCYKCKRQFYKEEGCNKMTCPCGALSCYVCDKPVKDYSHFNPQGGENTHLCPLWSDDRFMNAQAVRKVAEDMKKALLKNNPNLKIDTESLLPKLPSKTSGPHDDIPNANQLPEHVRRMAGAAP